MSNNEQPFPKMPHLVVEKMTATSTTSTNEDPTTDSEIREIQNALDKKRKKRRSSGSSENSQLYKHLKQASIQHYIEYKNDLETVQRISQDLPHGNWLEEKIKFNYGKTRTSTETSGDSEHGSHDNDVLVINDVGLKIVDDVTTNEDSSVTTETAPCISIPELEPGQSEPKIHVQIPSSENQEDDSFIQSLISFRKGQSSNESFSGKMKNEEDAIDLTNQVQNLKRKIEDLENERNVLHADIDSLKNKKIEEMSALLSLKSVHEKFQSSLLQLKIEVEKERLVLDSLKKEIHGKRRVNEETVSKSEAPTSKEKISEPSPMKILSKPLPLLAPKTQPPAPEPINYKKYASALNNKLENKQYGFSSNNNSHYFNNELPSWSNRESTFHNQSSSSYPRINQWSQNCSPFNKFQRKGRMNPEQVQQYHQMLRAHHGIPPPPYPYNNSSPLSMSYPRNSQSQGQVQGLGLRVKTAQELGQDPGELGCALCGQEANFVCSQCKMVHYCSELCQRSHWTVHGPHCHK